MAIVGILVFFKIFIYLFTYFFAALGLSCGMQDLSLQHAGSSLWCMRFSLVVAREFCICRMQAL